MIDKQIKEWGEYKKYIESQNKIIQKENGEKIAQCNKESQAHLESIKRANTKREISSKEKYLNELKDYVFMPWYKRIFFEKPIYKEPFKLLEIAPIIFPLNLQNPIKATYTGFLDWKLSLTIKKGNKK